MRKLNKKPRDYYRVKLLREFDLLKSKEAMQEVLGHTRFIRGQEKEIQKLSYQKNIFIKMEK